MIVKSLTRSGSASSVGYGQAIDYILKAKDLQKRVPPELIFTKNMLGKTKEDWINELKALENMRINPRQDNVKLHHYILSLSHLDGKDLPPELFADIANRFFELAPPSKYVCAVHLDKDSPQAHWHIIGSGVRLDNYRANRMSKEELANLKESLQSLHLEKYYEYTKNSEVKFKTQSPQKMTDAEVHIAKRGKQSEKELMREKLSELLSQSMSREQFYAKLEAEGISTYSRGKHDGVVLESGRHIRFASIGLQEKVSELDQVNTTLQELRSIRGEEKQNKEIVLEDKNIVVNYLQPEKSINVDSPKLDENEQEKDPDDIQIQFYPRTDSFEMER